MDATQCNSGYDLELSTCTCVGSKNDTNVKSTTKDNNTTADTSSQLLIAVVAGCVALLTFIGAIVYVMSSRTSSTSQQATLNPAFSPGYAPSPRPSSPNIYSTQTLNLSSASYGTPNFGGTK